MSFPKHNSTYPQSVPFSQHNSASLLSQPQRLKLPSNQPRPTQLPSQQVENTSNKMDKPAYNVEEVKYFPTYSILPINHVHLRSGKVLHKNSPPIIKEPPGQGEKHETSHSEKQNGKDYHNSNTTLSREVNGEENSNDLS